ncbi:MAG: hypothetical protein LBI28_03785 [Treponema sp.]|jgi:uncharacterized protein YcfL|nr:hypothetical protein [Treponema sp.]
MKGKIAVLLLFVLLSCNKEKNTTVIKEENIGSETNVTEYISVDKTVNENSLENLDVRNIPSIVDDETIEQIIINYLINYYKDYRTTSIELKEIRKINIGIRDMDCYIVIDSGYGNSTYYFFGLKNNEIIIFEHLTSAYELYTNPMIALLEGISSFYRIGNDLVFIGDVNHDGNDDIIIPSYGPHGSTRIQIWGSNKENDNISEYLYSYFETYVIFNNNGSISFHYAMDNSSGRNVADATFLWDNNQHKYYIGE